MRCDARVIDFRRPGAFEDEELTSDCEVRSFQHWGLALARLLGPWASIPPRLAARYRGSIST